MEYLGRCDYILISGTIWLSYPQFESIEPQNSYLGCKWMLSMVPGVSFMEMTRKVAYK